jgi:hypothetical protein
MELNSQQFDNVARVQEWKKNRKSRGDGSPWSPNPFATHIPDPKGEHYTDWRGERAFRTVAQHGIPIGSQLSDTTQSGPEAQNVPLARLESLQPDVDRHRVNGFARRSTEAPPIEVTHFVNEDRYVIGEGNHRATAALLQGKSHVSAEVVRRYTSKPVD